MIENKTIDKLKGISLFLLRLIVVLIFLYHGFPKATDWSMASDKFVAMGFPGFLGPIVGIAEVIASILILVGYWTPFASLVLAVIIFVAIVGVQIPGAVKAGKFLIAGLERDLLILMATLVLMAFGPGFFSIKGREKKIE